MAMGYVDAAHAVDGARFEIQIFEQVRPAQIHMTPLFDANGGRQRS
jgi:glycine cleavage system aminomethyltransferase T